MNERQHIRVLVVDDDEIDRMALRKALRQCEFDVDVSEEGSGTAAADRIIKERFDIVFLDYKLPGKSGLEILESVREENTYTPIVVFTARGNEHVAVQMMKSGATDYMTKNMMTPDGLSMAIRSALRFGEAERRAQAAERALRKSERLQRSILENMTDALFVVDQDKIICSANPRCSEITGYTKERLLGSSLDLVCGESEFKSLNPVFSTQIPRGGVCFDCDLRQRDGNLVAVQVSAFSVNEDQDTDQRLVGINIRDIRERLELEKLKDDFLSTVSHELRTPATSIFGSLRLLTTGAVGEVDADADELLDVCLRNAQRLIWMLNDILDIKKIEAGELDLQPDNVEPQELTNEAVASIAGYAATYGISIDVDLQESLPAICCDSNRTQQILANLLSNAIKFSPQNSKVSLRVQKSSNFVLFEVEDSGPGIPPEYETRIFEKFQQTPDTVRNKQGTGLGLAICKALVESQGGSIGFKNKRPNGAVFWFKLPIEQA